MRRIVVSALLLAAFTIVATGLVVSVHAVTATRVAEAERAVLLDRMHALVPAKQYDNDLLADRIEVSNSVLLGPQARTVIYRARREGAPVAVIVNTVAPDGYSGNIHLLVAVYHDGSVAGVRVTSHRETPGLGDKIEAGRSDWITRFDGRSLASLPDAGWNVKKDGGVFDQFTGATITPRAVVRAVHNTLRYVHTHRHELFAPPPQPQPQGAPHE